MPTRPAAAAMPAAARCGGAGGRPGRPRSLGRRDGHAALAPAVPAGRAQGRSGPRRAPWPPRDLTFERGLVGPLDGRERRVDPLQRGPPPRRARRAARRRDRLPGSGRRGPAAREARRVLARPVPRRQPGLDPQDDARRRRRRRGSGPGAATATMPIAADSWTMGDDVDGDVLAAYIESRRRA